MDCSTCHNSRHVPVRGTNGTARCPDCFNIVHDAVFIKQQIRGRAQMYPPQLDALPPWPLDGEVLIGGSISELARFKEMAWRSLAAYRFAINNRSYDYLDLTRFKEISFQRDNTYLHTEAVFELPLILFVFGVFDHKSDYNADLLGQVIMRRRDDVRGLWMFTPLTLPMIRERYGFAVADLLTDPRPAYL